jgi:hypothetical protein
MVWLQRERPEGTGILNLPVVTLVMVVTNGYSPFAEVP